MRNKLPTNSKKQNSDQADKQKTTKKNQFINKYSALNTDKNGEDVKGTDDNKDTVKIIMYHSDHCGHCQDFKPIWNQFEKYINVNRTDVDIDNIECTTNQDECEKANITSVPTVLLYNGDKPPVMFTGDRTLNGLKKFIIDQLG